MTNGRNFIAGVASSGWTALIGLLVVPWYIRYLGIEAYGMIGVHLTLQSLFVLLDLGLSPAVSREVARAGVSGHMAAARRLVHSMSVLFVVAGCLVAALLAAMAPWIARDWLHAGSLPTGQVTLALALSAVTVGLRWPATLYTGVLNGTRRIDLASAITIATTTLANGGAVAVLAFVEPSLRAFFLWQAAVGLLHSLAMRHAARRAIGQDATDRFDWTAIRSIWRFSAGMAGVAATGIVFSQIDKVVLMRTATLVQVGHYTIAIALTSVLYRLITPAFNVVYPQFCSLVEAGSEHDLSRQYHASTRLFLSLILPAAMSIVVGAPSILALWVHDPTIVQQTSLIVVLLCLGTAAHCIMYFPYALQLAKGNTTLPLTINLCLSLVFLPLVIVLALARGAVGVAAAWLVLHLCYVALGTWLTHRHILPGEGRRWATKAVGPPLAISVAFGFAAATVMPNAGSDVVRLLVCLVGAAGAAATNVLLMPEGRLLVRRATAGLT
ncbi:lipopolysaccharide biosynthesis protein [Sphingomonas sp. BK069]|uniref:lipopolysaccharide biosynthesis protein n=1 Tax=Sphingomonas sp. BK069 TaxID=2586979 RepID=UPI001607436C|nr:oligosaccharide flippase family protein [Sphingomonas sp. BK069]MBB3349633.1 O-antigen/teichoic acid export membrane protein [Sphingomonas sp. BK069]